MKSEWAEMQMNGFLGWVHKVVMFLTWPFRRFKLLLSIIIGVLIVMIIVPMCYGVAFRDIPSWYYQLIKAPFVQNVTQSVSDKALAIKNKATQQIAAKIDDVKQKVEQISPEIKAAEEAKAKGEPIKFTTWNVAKFNKVKYERPVQKKDEVKLKAPTFAVLRRETKEAQVKREQEIKKKQEEKKIGGPYYKGNLADYYRVRNDLGLTYLSESEKYHGKADVLGPNSLYIGNTYVYLYGIYTNPDIYDAAEAQLYLEELVEGKTVHCDVVAYTTQTQAATALCFVDGIFINGAMVNKALALDVALK